MSLITVDLRDRKQLYEQLIDNIKNLILTGELETDSKLPSVRSLAKELGINPNTIQKAYSELERCGIIITLPGRGSMIIAGTGELKNERLAHLKADLKKIAAEAFMSGITYDEYISAARSAYEEGRNNND